MGEIIQIYLTDEQNTKLLADASSENLSSTDFIKWKVFGGDKPTARPFSVEEIINEIILKQPTENFSLPEIMGEDRWRESGTKPYVARMFFKEIENRSKELGIEFVEINRKTRRAMYKYITNNESEE